MYTVYLLLFLAQDRTRTRLSTTYTSDSLPDILALREAPGVFDVGVREEATGTWVLE